MQFESPRRLEQRIAANMADESDDLSLGVARRAPSMMGSMSSVTDEASMSRSAIDDEGDESSMYYDDAGQRSKSTNTNQDTVTVKTTESQTAVLRPANGRVNALSAQDTPRSDSSKTSISAPMLSSYAPSNSPSPRVDHVLTVSTTSQTETPADEEDEEANDKENVSGVGDESSILEPESLRRKPVEKSFAETSYSKGNPSPSSEKVARRAISSTPTSARSSSKGGILTPRTKAQDQERMKAYLLNSVKNVNPLRQQQLRHLTPKGKRRPFGSPGFTTPGDTSSTFNSSSILSGVGTPKGLGKVNALQAGRTPLPNHLHRPSPLSAKSSTTPVANPEGTDSESISSDASLAQDLTTPRHMRANTSLPVAGIQDGSHFNAAVPVDKVVLQGFLHEINVRLEEENGTLREEVETLRRQFNKALKDNERLQKSTADPENGDSSSRNVADYAQTRIEELENGQNELNDLLDEREDELAEAKNKIEELEGQVARRKQDEGVGNDDAIVQELRERVAELEEMQQLASRDQSTAGGFEERLRMAMQEADELARKAEEELIRERDEIAGERDDLAEELDDVKAQLREAEAQRRRASTREAETNTSVDGVEKNTDDTIDRLDRMLSESEAQREEALERAARLDELCKEMEDRIADFEHEQADLVEQVKEIDEENIRLDEIITKTREELEDSKSQLSDMGIAVDEKENEIQRLTMQLRQTRQGSVGKGDTEEFRAEIASLKDKLATVEAELEETQRRAEQQPTPVHRSVAALKSFTLQTPKSPPQGELGSASWLYNESSLGDRGVVEHIHELEKKLDDANASIDNKLQELDRQGLSHIALAHKLTDAQLRAEALGKDRRIQLEAIKQRLARMKCPDCRSRFDGTKQVPIDPNAPASTSAAAIAPGADESSLSSAAANRSALRSSTSSRYEALDTVSAQLEDLKRKWAVDMSQLNKDRDALNAERQAFDAEKTALKGENRRLRERNAENDAARREAVRKVQETTQSELQRVKEAVASFKAELREDEVRVQALMRQSATSADVSAEVERELGRTEAILVEVDRELRSKVEKHHNLQEELLEKSQVGQDLPLEVYALEAQVRQLFSDVESLRNERNAILDQRQRLHAKFRTEHARMENAVAELSWAREAMLAHQKQLDEQIETIEGLHAALTSRDRELQTAVGDRDRLQQQRKEILSDVNKLEGDLRRVREESSRFGMDLQRLREEKRRIAQEETRMVEEERRREAKEEAEAKRRQEELLKKREAEQIDAARRQEERHRQVEMEQQLIENQIKIDKLCERLDRHRKLALDNEAEVAETHRKHCQGLMLQIRYVKAKLGREYNLRQDMIHQKSYLLKLVGETAKPSKTVRFETRPKQRLCSCGRPMQDDGAHLDDGSHSNPASMSRRQVARRRWGKVQAVVLAICRAKLMAKNWATTKRVGETLKEAYQTAKRENRFKLEMQEKRYKEQQQQQQRLV